MFIFSLSLTWSSNHSGKTLIVPTLAEISERLKAKEAGKQGSKLGITAWLQSGLEVEKLQ